MHAPGDLYILTAPSGGGKTTLARQLVASMDNIQLSVSYTTRPARPGEVSGKDYLFVDYEEFEKLLLAGEFLESAKVHDYLYATSLNQVERCLYAGMDMILAIDWQGAEKVRLAWGEQGRKMGVVKSKVISIFILPPSKRVLQQRLYLRGQDDAMVMSKRLAAASGEVRHYEEFDYLIVNDVLEKAVQEIQTIIHANRLGRQKQALRYRALLKEWFE